MMLTKFTKVLSFLRRFSVPRLWEASRKYFFCLIFLAIVVAKLVHLFAHRNSLTIFQFLLWGITFFILDFVCIALAWGATRRYESRWARILVPFAVVPASIGISGMASANMSFFITTGAEIHWRQAHSFHRDAASIKTLLSGLAGMVMVEIAFLVVSYFTSPYLFNFVEEYMKVWGATMAPVCAPLWAPLRARLCRICRRGTKSTEKPEIYEPLATDESAESDAFLLEQQPEEPEPPRPSRPSLLKRCLVFVPTVAVLLLWVFRPSGAAYGFLSQTLILSPLAGPNTDNSGTLLGIPDLDEYSWLGNRTALDTPKQYDWLPDEELPGFRDWYSVSSNGTVREGPAVHYNAAQDPLHISNLDEDILEPLREVLKSGDVKIKHIFLLKLESTRYDVFPIRPDNYIHNRVRESYGDEIPPEVMERLTRVSRIAERMYGVEKGLDGNPVTPYGGIHATDSYTAGTFTLKSITGTVCGLTPLVVDFNREYLHHIYQPCLPHVLNALNSQLPDDNATEEFTSWPWKPWSMQSITDDYDYQYLLTPELGFEGIVNVDTMDADYGDHQPEKVNFWGYPDDQLRDYFRDAINKAEEEQERLFITHLTGGTHHPWDLLHNAYEEMVGSTWMPLNRKFNRYLNTLAYADGWLRQILEVLEETGVANETLIVMTGDHGITLPEDGGVTPYDNPHVANFHVPLVFGHPKLPSIEVDSRVTSMQILPTILDLLRESGSLDEAGTQVINDLLPLYEGQSIIRTPIPEKDGKPVWQFSVMNTGGTWLAVRSATQPFRLVIPLVPDVEWRFSDISTDPEEKDHIMSFDLDTLLGHVKDRHSPEAVQWAKDAAYVSKWWVKDNWSRYEYNPEDEA